MTNFTVINGQTGPYTPINSENWGRNANVNAKEHFRNIPVKGYNPKDVVVYSKPLNPVVQTLKNIVKGIEKQLRKAGILPEKSVNPRVNFKSLFGFADEDLKGFETDVKKNPVLAPADTDNSGKITPVEDAAFTLFQDMLDEQPNLEEKDSIEIKASDADGKITNVGFTNSMGLLLGKSKDNTKKMLTVIRDKFDLDKKAQSLGMD